MRRIFIICMALCFLLYACTEPTSPEPRTRTVFAMDTVMDLTVYTENEVLLTEASKRILELENKLSVTISGSEIHTLNTTGTSTLSEDTLFLLESALELCKNTNGELDISIYPVLSAWGFTTGEYQVPASDELNALLEKVDYSAVNLSDNICRIPDGMQLDMGSVAKGYTGDLLCEYFREEGIASALLNLGGNVHALGCKPDGTPWRVAVQHPTNSDYLGVLELDDMAAITSGGYERYFTDEDGEVYWHIIDPSDGYPADNGLVSVTVVGKRGLICDAMSTALFIMGLDDGVEYWRSRDDFDVIFVTEDEKVYITEGVADIFTMSDAYADMPFEILER